jgi:hypothetical protein
MQRDVKAMKIDVEGFEAHVLAGVCRMVDPICKHSCPAQLTST